MNRNSDTLPRNLCYFRFLDQQQHAKKFHWSLGIKHITVFASYFLENESSYEDSSTCTRTEFFGSNQNARKRDRETSLINFVRGPVLCEQNPLMKRKERSASEDHGL